MIITCSNCKTRFNVKQEKLTPGKILRCIKCKNVLDLGNKQTPDKPGAPQKGDQQKEEPSGRENGARKIDLTMPPPMEAVRPKIEKKKAAGAPMWIVTFADLSTLMLTFFVLLLSFASMDIAKFKDMLGSVQEAFGVQTKRKGDYQATLQGSDPGKTDASGSAAKEKEQIRQMAHAVQASIDKAAQSQNISVSAGAHGVRVRIKGTYVFDPGSALLKRTSLLFLQSIAQVVKKFPFKLKVEGHTDNRPISTPQFASNWELSAIRATTVLRYFIEEMEIDKLRLTAIGYADNKPLATNDEIWGRAKNRRVEFVFYK